jgi:hypothetical protein
MTRCAGRRVLTVIIVSRLFVSISNWEPINQLAKALCHCDPVFAAWRATGSSLLYRLVVDLCQPRRRTPSAFCSSGRETFEAQDRFSQLLTFQAEFRQDFVDIHHSSGLTTFGWPVLMPVR